MADVTLPYDIIQELVEIMKYTFYTIEDECRSICNVEYNTLSYTNLAQIDTQIFQCSCCGYWFTVNVCVSDENEELWCEACYSERNDYDDM